MTLTETLFILGNMVVLPFWLMMILLPRWDWTQRIIGSPWIILPPALCYVLVLLVGLSSASLQFKPDFTGIVALLGTPAGAAATWLHLVTFDLFAGRWVYLQRQTRNASIPITSVILLFVFLVGPFGFLLYLAASWLERRNSPSAS